MPSTEFVLVDPRFRRVSEAVMRALTSHTGTTNDIRADLALEAALDAYGLPSEFWPTGGDCTARYVSFAPGGNVSEDAPHIAITDDASADHSIAEHNGWCALRYGPEFDGFPDTEVYNSQSPLENLTLADMAYDSASCARAIRNWYDGADTRWTRNEVSLNGISGPYRCQTRSEHWEGYCAPRFTPAVMRQICADTQTAHRAGAWNAPAHFEDATVVIITPLGRTEVPPDEEGHYRPGAFHWPWTEYTDRDTAPVTKLIQTVRWRYEHHTGSWTVITADHGWRAKVIDALPTPSPTTAPHVADALNNAVRRTALSSYQVTATSPGAAAAAVRAHFAATRADREPDATVQVFDRPGTQVPASRP